MDTLHNGRMCVLGTERDTVRFHHVTQKDMRFKSSQSASRTFISSFQIMNSGNRNHKWVNGGGG